ncbi:MAG: hypothetical protein JNN05_06805, partial [Candidatus Omnitrophica bacterium]|nr:hypothetical protein [Candidatus Omnitrophota bacterium]
MRVAIVPFEFPVLSETFVINIATGLIDNGHDVGIFPLYGKPVDVNSIHPVVNKYGLLNKTSYPPRMTLMKKELYLPLFFRFLFLEKDFDIIHFQFGTAALKCLPFRYLKFFKGRWVVSFRGFDISSVLKEKGADIYRTLFKKADL